MKIFSNLASIVESSNMPRDPRILIKVHDPAIINKEQNVPLNTQTRIKDFQ